MLTRVSIQGLGPHDHFEAELSPRGVTRITGPSEAGKTTLIDAVLFALWGRSSTSGSLPAETIRDGARKAVVDIALEDGRAVHRTLAATASGSRRTTRAITDGGTHKYRTEAQFQEALGDLGRDPEAMALVVQPLGWVPLVQGNARGLRDVLARILPAGDVPGEVMARMRAAGFAVERAEASLAEDALVARRRQAKKDRDEANGQVTAHRDRLADLEAQAEAPSDAHSAIADAEAVLAAADAWAAHERAEAGAVARAEAERAQAQWDARRDELGLAPAYEPGALEAAIADERAADRALQRARGETEQADADKRAADKKLRDLELAGGDVCPTCGRDGWREGEAVVDEHRRAAEAAAKRLDDAVDRAKQAADHHKRAAAELDAVRAVEREWTAYNRALTALGPRPQLPAQAEGERPSAPRPDDDAIAAARARLDRAVAEEGARAQRARDRADTRDKLLAAQAVADTRDAEVARLNALIDAVREAPSAVAAAQRAALGDLGPVSLHFGDNPAVRVDIDGRPWWLASRGRQVVADMWLRAGLRRALGAPRLPIFVDNAQDVGGQSLPDVDGPVVILQTTADPALSITHPGTDA